MAGGQPMRQVLTWVIMRRTMPTFERGGGIESRLELDPKADGDLHLRPVLLAAVDRIKNPGIEIQALQEKLAVIG